MLHWAILSYSSAHHVQVAHALVAGEPHQQGILRRKTYAANSDRRLLADSNAMANTRA